MSDLTDTLKRVDPDEKLGKVREYRHSSNFIHPTDYIIRLADAALFEVLTEVERLKDMVFAREAALEEIEADETRNCWDMYRYQLDRAEKAEAEVERLKWMLHTYLTAVEENRRWEYGPLRKESPVEVVVERLEAYLAKRYEKEVRSVEEKGG